ncbi:anthranilate synthase component I family protein [Candidatus Haliotispira prima]|uniref:Anthranilate synthase component I family protein n=1 Tax=Candidatus Haliotispira prima TaxID=3034016 RepID=A0ABY8MI65_9SPIO|nr:anthranilate synthase component I family protein [Candidatus Haliotispira prima]
MELPCYPSSERFSESVLQNPGATHAQISCPLNFDCINPMTILTALQHEEQFFLLESATAEKTISRYSFFACQMERRFRCLAREDGSTELWLQEYPRGQESGDGKAGPESCLNKDSKESPFDLLFRHSIDRPRPIRVLPLPPSNSIHHPKWQGFQGGLVGMFSYESVRHMGVLRRELKQLSTPSSRYGQQPEMLFYEVQRFFVIDNARQRLFAVCLVPLPSAGQPGTATTITESYNKGQKILQEMTADLQEKLNNAFPGAMLPSVPADSTQLAAELSRRLWQEDQSEEQQRETIEQLRRELIAGEGLQVVYSIGRQGPPMPAALFYRLLRQQNPSPYMFFLKDGEQHILGSSPETHLRYQDGIACIKPLAGTRPLAENLSESELQKIIDDLLQDPKERAEHLMLIDLARNDLYTNCEPDSVRTVKEFVPEVFSHVVHIVSEVQGRLQPAKKPYQLFAKTFPAGTLSGAPKVRAMELIDQYEKSPRGFYGGCIGYFNYDGSFDSAIVIRSAWIDSRQTLVRSGGGLVYDSKPDYEIREHRQKLGILSTVLQTIQQTETPQAAK